MNYFSFLRPILKGSAQKWKIEFNDCLPVSAPMDPTPDQARGQDSSLSTPGSARFWPLVPGSGIAGSQGIGMLPSIGTATPFGKGLNQFTILTHHVVFAQKFFFWRWKSSTPLLLLFHWPHQCQVCLTPEVFNGIQANVAVMCVTRLWLATAGWAITWHTMISQWWGGSCGFHGKSPRDKTRSSQ